MPAKRLKITDRMVLISHGCFGHESSQGGTTISIWRKDNKGRKNFATKANKLDCQMGELYFLPSPSAPSVPPAKRGRNAR